MQLQIKGQVPPLELIQSLVAKTVEVRRSFAPCSIPCSREEKRRAPRLRPGGEKIARVIADIADAVGFELPGMPTVNIRSALDYAQRLEPLQAEIGRLAAAVEDTSFEAQAECWSLTTAYYSALKKASRVNPGLQHALREPIEYFATGPRAHDDESAEANAVLITGANAAEVTVRAAALPLPLEPKPDGASSPLIMPHTS